MCKEYDCIEFKTNKEISLLKGKMSKKITERFFCAVCKSENITYQKTIKTQNNTLTQNENAYKKFFKNKK